MRLSFSFAPALCLIPMMTIAQPPRTLAAMRDRYRPLLVFEGGNAKLAEQQMTMLATHSAAMRERQVLIVGVEGTDKSLPTVMLSPAEWEAAQRRFRNKPDRFAVVLLGKDGGEKLRSSEPVSWDKLQSTIDAMPMRKEEAAPGRR